MRKILLVGLLAFFYINTALFAMDEGELIAVQLKDLARKERQRDFFYPEVLAAQNNSHGCAIADIYFTDQLPNTKIADMIPYKDAVRYWIHGGNLPQAALVIPAIKDFTKQVMTQAFELRINKTVHGGELVDQELFEALKKLNAKIGEDPQQLAKWQEIKRLVAEFSEQKIESRKGYLGHDV